MSNALYSRDILKQYFQILVPLLGLLLLIATTHYYTHEELTDTDHKADAVLSVDLARETITAELNNVVSDLIFLSNINELRAVLANPSSPYLKNLERELLIFSRIKKRYDQIRYIAQDGQEIVRINYHNGEAVKVAKTTLMNKANDDFFKQALAIKPEQIHLSSLDRNVKQEAIETPHKPVIRFATPLINAQGQKRGILVFNILGNSLLPNFTPQATTNTDRIHLLNQEGYWLRSPYSDAPGLKFDRKRSFAISYPLAWQQISANLSGSFENSAGLFSYSTIYPVWPTAKPSKEIQSWKIVSLAPMALIKEYTISSLFFNNILFGAFALLIIIWSFVTAKIRVSHKKIKAQNEYEQRFRKTLESIQLAAISLDDKGKVQFCNNYLLKKIGFKHEDVINKEWIDNFIEEAEKEKMKEILANAMAGSLCSIHETKIKTRGGDTRLFSWNNTLSYDANDRVCGLTCIGEDITEQHHREEQLRILSRAVEQSPAPVILTNTDGVIEYVNSKFTELTGYTAAEAIGNNPSILKSGETNSEEYRDLWETIDSGKEWHGLFHNRRKNGELYWEYTTISPIRNPDGEITHFLAIKEDITEKRRLENEVKQRNRELAQAQALAVVGRMSSMIAHDLRNPLSSIKMGLQIFGKRVDKQHEQSWNEEAKELRQIALEQVRYMENILADLLQFSRPDALNSEWLSINKLLDLTVSTTEKNIKEHKAKVTTDYQAKLPMVYGDATKLRQVFSNLILNALQATENIERKPEIRIKTSMELLNSKMKVKVEFSDNGLGLDSEQADILFEPFYTTKAKGTGLGLAIVKRILDQHYGEISLASSPNGGACVVVILPTGPFH
ncbi:diguanylate cyclase/phosphodiesterase (GGDEF & EAL domains) with PAS/PAC sensor(s) [hydrothermal vent metagenome]|uniref:Diguanylate cyclase/phosphodiesterase (GGDEF & EAL domains) with PAS/PAC sensor(S) n=1 Tax=hydrothermal vent metagenome TaxID=652676 RepID=A0A3B1A5Z5_9ZZZZ